MGKNYILKITSINGHVSYNCIDEHDNGEYETSQAIDLMESLVKLQIPFRVEMHD